MTNGALMSSLLEVQGCLFTSPFRGCYVLLAAALQTCRVRVKWRCCAVPTPLLHLDLSTVRSHSAHDSSSSCLGSPWNSRGHGRSAKSYKPLAEQGDCPRSDWGCRPQPRLLGAQVAGPCGVLLALRLAPGPGPTAEPGLAALFTSIEQLVRLFTMKPRVSD